MSTWVWILAAAVAYVVVMLLVAQLLRRRRREIDELWDDLYAWEAAQKKAARARQEGCTRGSDVPPPPS